MVFSFIYFYDLGKKISNIKNTWSQISKASIKHWLPKIERGNREPAMMPANGKAGNAIRKPFLKSNFFNMPHLS